MFETPFSLVGTVATDPVPRRIGDDDYLRFRVASNSRRRTPEGSWEHGNSLFVTVHCWGKLATHVSNVLYKGDPVVVIGHVYTNDYDDREGNRRTAVEVRASAVGPDLTRCRAKLDRSRSEDGQAAAAEPEVEQETTVEVEDPELSLSA
ncbi:single-stranded DNA-binding protein [Mycobacterium sp. NPDC003323]